MQNLIFSKFHTFCSILSVFIMFFSFVIFFTLIYYPRKLSRINLLIIIRSLYLFFTNFLLLFFSINNHFEQKYNYSTQVLSNFHLSFLFLTQVSINIEFYRSLRNPCYIIKYIFNNEFEILINAFIIIIISCVISICPFFFLNQDISIYDFIFSINNDDYFDISFYANKILSPLIVLSFSGLIYLYIRIRLYYSHLKEKSLEHLKYKNVTLLIINILYLCFAIFLIIIKFFYPEINSQYFHLITLILYFLDIYFHLFIVFHSGFYYYCLNKTFIGFIYNILFLGFFWRNSKYSRYCSLNISKHTQSINNFFNYKNYIIEDYTLDTLDFMLQSITTGLSIVYDDLKRKIYYFQSKIDFLSVENERMRLNSIKTSNSNITKSLLNRSDESNNNSNTNNDINEDESTSNMNSLYNFFQICSRSNIGNDDPENDRFSFKDCEDSNIVICPIFVKESIESMNLYKISKKEIIKSLLSHKFLSLLLTKSKRIFFKNINNLIINTYDGKFLIEMHTDIKLNKNFRDRIKQYFEYLNYGNFNSFMPVLLGVFRIKINNFKEIIVFISQNPLIEKIPKDYYNYWEILRYNFDEQSFIKFVSSKDNESFIVMGQFEDSKLNKHHIKFHLDDFKSFKEVIKNDIKFFKKISSKDFCLVLLYYEFENKNMNKNSIFIDNKPLNPESPFSIPKNTLTINNFFSEEINKKNNQLILSFSHNSHIQKKEDITTINEVTEDSIDKEIAVDVDMKKKTNDISGIQSMSNMSRSIIMNNGFDAYYNNYRVLLYFRWDNIFCHRNCVWDRYYNNYIYDVSKYFSN